jgi:hypothetical protein
LPTHIRFGFPSGLFPSGISYMHSYSPPFLLHALPIHCIYIYIYMRECSVPVDVFMSRILNNV